MNPLIYSGIEDKWLIPIYRCRKTHHVGHKTHHVGCKTQPVGRKTQRVGRKTQRVGRKTQHDGRKTQRVGTQNVLIISLIFIIHMGNYVNYRENLAKVKY